MLTSFYPPPVSDVIINGHFLRILSESCGSQRVTFYRPFTENPFIESTV